MNNLSVFMLSFCSSCILLGFLYILCPKGSIASSVKYVFCLCFLCCVLSGITNMPEIDFKQFKSASETQIITEQSAAATAQTIFARALISQNINFTKIIVDTNKLSNGSITINKVTVYSQCSAEQIMSAIGSNSYEVCVINE